MMKPRYFILSFFVGFMAMALFVTIYHEVRVRQPENFFQQIALFRSPAVRPSVLLVGDSRMALGVRQDGMPAEYYNLSYPGQTLQQIYLRTKFALESKPDIRYLVLGLEDSTLSWLNTTPFHVSDQLLYADLLDLAEVYGFGTPVLVKNGLIHYFPLVNETERGRAIQQIGDDVAQLVEGASPFRTRAMLDQCGGFRLVDVRWGQFAPAERQRLGRERAVYLLSPDSPQVKHRAVHDFETDQFTFDPRMRDALRKLLRLAAAHDVKVIGLRTPVSREYLQGSESFDLSATFEFYRRQNLLAMLDYHRLFDGNTEFFADADHLNDAGAAVLTERLVQDLRHLTGIGGEPQRRCLPAPGWNWPYNDILSGWLRPHVG